MRKAIFNVIKPGLLTTVQDLGRYGYQQFGISPSGALDPYSMKAANILVGNHFGEAVLEVSFTGPLIEALHDTVIAVCGGDFSLKIDGDAVPMWRSLVLRKGQLLEIGRCPHGARGYLAVAGGIDVPVVLGSRSTFLNGKFGGFEGRTLQKGDILFGIHPFVKKPLKIWPSNLIPIYKRELEIKVLPGPHQHLFTEESLERFFGEKYLVTSKSNRMGYQLKGPELMHKRGPDIISDPVPLGGIQVPASGQPIILLAERQTTGGYTRIGTVISVDLPRLAQAVPGTEIHFAETTLQEAQRLYLQQHVLFKHLALAAK